MDSMRFEPLYYADRLTVVNPYGDVGLVTLWSTQRATRRVFDRISPNLLDPAKSRIAVVSNLYGDGMHQMFCNLLFNPQIRHLVAVGEEMGQPTVEELKAFLEYGTEKTFMLGATVLRITGTDRIFPALDEFDAKRLRQTLSFRYLGRLGELSQQLGTYLSSLPHYQDDSPERVRVTIPPAVPDDYSCLPSDITSHQIRRRTALDAWRELVTRVVRFGQPVRLHSGPRIELLNTRVVITKPGDESSAELRKYGFSLERFREYQLRMLDDVKPDGVTYTYGNRLRGYFPQLGGNNDALTTAAKLLKEDPQTRRAYISLWDTAADLGNADTARDTATPCLVAVFFRRSEGRLTMTATYRAHNLLTAWMQNIYGLMAIQRFVCEKAEMEPGPLTVISHQLGIDPRSPQYELAKAIAGEWTRDEDVDPETGKYELRQDPNGYFVVTVDEETDEVVADHKIDGLSIKRYRSRDAGTIAQKVAADMAVTLVSHALWLGRELAAKEAQLRRRRQAQ